MNHMTITTESPNGETQTKSVFSVHRVTLASLGGIRTVVLWTRAWRRVSRHGLPRVPGHHVCTHTAYTQLAMTRGGRIAGTWRILNRLCMMYSDTPLYIVPIYPDSTSILK
jgi:hypothetical protein